MIPVSPQKPSDPPRLALGPGKTWGGLSVMPVSAGPGRHGGDRITDHRLILYYSAGVAADCSCEGLQQKRLQEAGHFDVVPAGAAGFWTDETACDMVSVRIAPSLIAQVADALALSADPWSLSPRLGAHDPLIEQLVRSLAAEAESAAPNGRLFVDSLGVILTTRLLQGYARLRQTPPLRLPRVQERRLIDYIQANLDQDLSLEQLSTVAGISVPHLTSLFRKTFGLTVHRYVMEQRVARAHDLLLERRMSVTEIALECGFSHASHLARWMRRVSGVRPSDILRSH